MDPFKCFRVSKYMSLCISEKYIAFKTLGLNTRSEGLVFEYTTEINKYPLFCKISGLVSHSRLISDSTKMQSGMMKIWKH